MEKDFRDLLEKQSFLPLNSINWKVITVDHSESSNKLHERKQITTLTKDVGSGIYIYIRKRNNEVLYIGEGDIAYRLTRHFKKTYKTDKENSRVKFFNSKEQKEELLVYCKTVTDTCNRKAIEALLTVVLKPKYIYGKK